MLLVGRKQIQVAEPSLGKAGSQSQNFQQWAEMRSVLDLRVNTPRELKAQIVKKIGSKQAELYFSLIRKFLSFHLSKEMLDKLVPITIGRENVVLHNQLIKSILTNAVLCHQAPPVEISSADDHVSNHMKHTASFNNGPSHSPALLAPPNTDVSLSSLHRATSNILLDQHFGEDKGKSITAQKQHVICRQRKHSETKQILQQDDEPMISEKRLKANTLFSAKVPHPELKLESFPPSTIEAPLGIKFCQNGGDQRRCFLQPLPAYLLAQDITEEELMDLVLLPDSERMHKIMEQIAVGEGLDDIGGDCGEVLNRALDSYLKRLITSCVEFVRSRARRRNDLGTVLNCTSWGNNNLKNKDDRSELLQDRCSAEILEAEKDKPNSPLSLENFKMAMEIMSHQVGASWPVQLEKISFRIYDH